MTEAKRIRTELLEQYFPHKRFWDYAAAKLVRADAYLFFRFLYHLRCYEYLRRKKGSMLAGAVRMWHMCAYRRFSVLLGFSISPGSLGKGVVFHHRATIVIHTRARIGENCRFHGACCIGVKHNGDAGVPVIGNNVEIGAGAVILGDISIADEVVIGANAVVLESVREKGSIVAGNPAAVIR